MVQRSPRAANNGKSFDIKLSRELPPECRYPCGRDKNKAKDCSRLTKTPQTWLL